MAAQARDEDEPSAAPSAPWAAAPRLLGAAAGVLLSLHALAYFYWTEDDAGISFRYVTNLLAGHGLVYNPGQRVEAISNLGYVLLLTPFQALFSGVAGRPGLLVIAKLLGLLAALAGLREAWRLGGAVGLAPSARGLVLLLMAGSAPYAAWSVGALETPFIGWLSLALLASFAELGRGCDARVRRSALLRAGLAGVGLVLLRTDGFVLPVVTAGVCLVLLRQARSALFLLLPAALGFAGVTAFRLGYYGHALPNPVGAKLDLARALGALPETLGGYVWPFLVLHGGPLLIAALLLGLGGRDPEAGARRALAASLLGLLGYVTLVRGDWMPLYRFLSPTVGPLLVLGVAGLGRGLAWLRRDRRGAFRSLPIALTLALGLGLAALEALAGRDVYHRNRAQRFWFFEPTLSPRKLLGFWLPAVDWLERNVPADATLLTSEAGFIPYLSGLHTVDSYGLTDRTLAALPKGSVVRSSLGVHTAFTAGAPQDPAQRYVAAVPAAAIVLQERMLRTWNQGELPETLFAGRYTRSPASPLGGIWAAYLPASSLPRALGEP